MRSPVPVWTPPADICLEDEWKAQAQLDEARGRLDEARTQAKSEFPSGDCSRYAGLPSADVAGRKVAENQVQGTGTQNNTKNSLISGEWGSQLIRKERGTAVRVIDGKVQPGKKMNDLNPDEIEYRC